MDQATVYATVEDMIKRYSKQDLMLLTEREDSVPGEINLPVLEQALDDATAEINGFISGRYPLPLDPVPAALERNCCDIARYFLYGDKAPEQIEKRYHAVIKFLMAVSNGSISLSLPAEEIVNNGDELTVTVENQGSVFSRNNSKGFI